MFRKGKPMADVSNVRGPSGHPEPEKKEKTSPDTEKFKAELRKKAKTVGKIDPEEQKKRKQQAEVTEASKRSSTPTSEKRDLSLQKPFQAPPVRKKWAPEGQRPVTPGPPQSERTTSGPAEESAPVGRKRGAKEAEPPIPLEQPTEVLPAKEEEGTALPLEPEKEKLVEEAAAEQVVAPAPPPPPPPSLAPEKEEKKKVEEKEKLPPIEELPVPMLGQQQPEPTPTTPSAVEPLPPYAHLPTQVQELFDRMVGVMTVMNLSGITETVLTLNAPQFASSVFFGAQIIIREFSTAPKAFNVQLNGQPQAVALFQSHADDLMAAFQRGNYAFRINRLETGYQTERPLFKRKEKVSGDQQDQKGDSPP